jgi:hypothetical protein
LRSHPSPDSFLPIRLSWLRPLAARAWQRAARGPIPLVVPGNYWGVGSRPEDIELGKRAAESADMNSNAARLTGRSAAWVAVTALAQTAAAFCNLLI